MIGVIASGKENESVEEFFQLFKTPWEFARTHKSYRVLLATVDSGWKELEAHADLVVISSSCKLALDQRLCAEVAVQPGHQVEWRGDRIPIYGELATFTTACQASPVLKSRDGIAGFLIEKEGQRVVRLGYDLFQEVDHLLSSGQPASRALVPSLELHISIFRTLVLESRIPLIEIPPIPQGYEFVCCLTHDIDFCGIRRHKLDRTVSGFLYRALIGTLLRTFKERRNWRRVWTNWKAAFSWPLVLMGLKRDFWQPFEGYLQMEEGFGSTFFLIPFKDRPGTAPSGAGAKGRAVKYDVSDIPSDIDRLRSKGCEIGLHGLDAWRDPEAGKSEMNRISAMTQETRLGIRMHWLYFDENAPAKLEQAGFEYDSTLGYNDAVGYRAGTCQVFRLAGTRNLLELPLHIQDTALFYPRRMGLVEEEAFKICSKILEDAVRFGGVLTLNWHGRSLVPERLWGAFYAQLLQQIRQRRVWFATARQAVDWFRQRRSINFRASRSVGDKPPDKVKVSAPKGISPPVVVRHYRSAGSGREEAAGWNSADHVSFAYSGGSDLEISL